MTQARSVYASAAAPPIPVHRVATLVLEVARALGAAAAAAALAARQRAALHAAAVALASSRHDLQRRHSETVLRDSEGEKRCVSVGGSE